MVPMSTAQLASLLGPISGVSDAVTRRHYLTRILVQRNR